MIVIACKTVSRIATAYQKNYRGTTFFRETTQSNSRLSSAYVTYCNLFSPADGQAMRCNVQDNVCARVWPPMSWSQVSDAVSAVAAFGGQRGVRIWCGGLRRVRLPRSAMRLPGGGGAASLRLSVEKTLVNVSCYAYRQTSAMGGSYYIESLGPCNTDGLPPVEQARYMVSWLVLRTTICGRRSF